MDEIPHDVDGDERSDGFVVDALSAAALLGVNRTRLSQLTSKGVFPFQRRRIGTRLRLFYRQSDLEAHLEAQHRPRAPMLRANPSPTRMGAQALGFDNPVLATDDVLETSPFLEAAKQPSRATLGTVPRPRPTSAQTKFLPVDRPLASELAERRAQSELLERLLGTVERMAERQLAIETELVSLRRSLALRGRQGPREENVAQAPLPSARELARRRLR